MRYSLIALTVVTAAFAAPQNIYGQSVDHHRVQRRTFPPPPKVAMRSAKTIMGALGQVKSSVDGLDAVVLRVKGADGASVIPELATKGSALGDTIKAAQAKIDGAEETDLPGALGIQDAATTLGKSLDRLSRDLISIEPVVRKAGLDSAVVSILKQQQSSSGSLVDAVTEKLPVLAQDLAKDQTAGVTKSLNRVIDAYEKGASAPKASSTPS